MPATRTTITWQRREQRLFGREVLADGARAGGDAAGVALPVPPVDHRVELGECVHFGDGDEVVAAEPAELAIDAAVLVGAADVGLAVEGVEAVVGVEGGPTFSFHPAA
jgi:hypothetical protein